MEQHAQGCVGYILFEIFKSWSDIILTGWLELKQNFPLHEEITTWDLEVCAIQEMSQSEVITNIHLNNQEIISS